MRLLRFFTVAIALIMATCFTELQSKERYVPNKAYIFGFATSFTDSTIYITEIQQMDSLWIENKTFMLDRDNYSYQLKNYLDKQGQQHRTCMMFFAIKRKDIDKKYEKIKKKYVTKGNYYISYLRENDFQFQPIAIDDYLLQAAKNEKKEKKSKEKKERGNRPPMGGPGGPGGPGGQGGPGGAPGGGPGGGFGGGGPR
ncbi:MAG: hypothetical protein LUC88_08330 [Prevotella sp.]|nr:hypothetical protein [Prevotella sp.]